jgi:hypothetical protein
MLLKFKGKDSFGNLAFTASEGKFPTSYHDLVKKNQRISKMSLCTFNPIYISPRYTFACITFKKNYNQFDTPVVGSIFEVKFTLTKTDFKEKTFVNANIIDLTLIEEPKEEEVLDF